MANLGTIVLLFFGIYFLQTQAADKYTDQNRPYEFGFTIDGEQHRHEKKDENGIIMGEFGFITADGVYHVTVYATDENGNFKILSMKNIRVKPYPTSPGAGVKNTYIANPTSAKAGAKKSNSLTIAAPPKDSIPEATKEEKTIKKQVASPAKSCSHCRLPTTTTTTTVSPPISKSSVTLTNDLSPENKNINNLSNKNPISLQNTNDQQQDNELKTHQANPPIIAQNHPQEEQINKNSQNVNSLPSEKFGSQEPTFKRLTLPLYPPNNNNNQKYPQQDISNNPIQAVNPEVQQYFKPQKSPLSTEPQISIPDVKQNNPGVSNVGSINSQPNQNPLSRNLQGPINEETNGNPPNQAFVQNKETNNGFKNDNQNNLNIKNNYNSEAESYPRQDSKINKPDEIPISSPPTTISRQTIQSRDEGEKSALVNPKSERSPKSFGDFIHQSVGPEELASTGPNLYRPSLPKPSEFSGKPVLLAAQMQKVDQNTNIYNKNPGESDGLPEGVTMDDVTNLLYTFNYTVGFHGHHEKGYQNGAKQGYYYVTGRNGVRTRVDYVADEKGFRPKITQEILDIVSDEVPKPETEKDEKYGLKGYEFKWLYFPLESKSISN